MDARLAEPAPPTQAEALDLGPLGHALGFLLRVAQLDSFARFYAELGELGLKPGEFSALMVLSRNPDVRQGLLAERLRIKRAHMTKLVKALEAKGLVERRVPEEDRRSLRLRLTERGRIFVARHEAAFTAHDAGPARGLTPQEHARLVALLRKQAGLD